MNDKAERTSLHCPLNSWFDVNYRPHEIFVGLQFTFDTEWEGIVKIVAVRWSAFCRRTQIIFPRETYHDS